MVRFKPSFWFGTRFWYGLITQVMMFTLREPDFYIKNFHDISSDFMHIIHYIYMIFCCFICIKHGGKLKVLLACCCLYMA